MSFKLGSLFDGSGGFPLAGALCGIRPVWASEVEPYPIAVTRERFPDMKHLGDISKVSGAQIEPVDIITFGSPCQDLSVAGKRAGLKHESNGDEETTRSGLFMEAVRIIKEMREATNGVYPRFALWENVPGAFSSNRGEDFRIVLEELIKIVEPTAVMPEVPKNGWPYADSYSGDGWSLAYRVFDAQYWGVPQRRRRIHLVLDLGGQCAGEVLFEREGLRGHFTQGRTPWQGIACNAERSVGADDSEGAIGLDLYNQVVTGDKSMAIRCKADNEHTPTVMYAVATAESVIPINTMLATRHNQLGRGTGLGIGEDGDPQFTISTEHCHAVCYQAPQVVAFDRAAFNQGQNALYSPQFYTDGTEPTLVAKGPSGVCTWDGGQTVGTLTANNAGGNQRMPDKDNFNAVIECRNTRYIVRRLTPTECARLQGFPDTWGHPTPKEALTDEEYRFWLDVRNTHAAINGKQVKDYSKEQILTWYNKLHTDSSEYKMWGNGIALPPALYCMQGIVEALDNQKDKTI